MERRRDAECVLCSRALRPRPRRDAIACLGARAAGFSGKVLIIASRSARAILSGIWSETFPKCGLDFEILPFGGECSLAEISRGKEAACEIGATVIVGVGGGKALDTARAVASELALPVACCPTTASSDAPCSALSVVYTEGGVF